MTLWLLQLSVALTSATVRPPAAQALVLSDQAVRLLALDSRSLQTEFLGCMIGEIRNGVVRVDRIAVDAIMCGAKVVWIGPDMIQREFAVVGHGRN